MAAVIMLLLSSASNSYAENNTIVIHVETDKAKYVSGDVVKISGGISDAGKVVNGKVTIQVKYLNDNKYTIVDNESIYTKNGSFNYNATNLFRTENTGIRIGMYNIPGIPGIGIGMYNISASVNDTKTSNWTVVQVMDFIRVPAILILLISEGVSFIGLIILLILTSYRLKGERCVNPEYFTIPEILRFLFIFGIAASPIISFITLDMELGTNSALGLVIRHPFVADGKRQRDLNEQPLSEWVIHIAGTPDNNYATGLNIPFYIFTFGITGGFLRYLYKTKGKEFEHTRIGCPTSAGEFVQQTLGELANVLLSPLLAIAVWFILSQGDARTNVYIMAALSFIVGLITEEVIHALILFAKGRIKEIGKDNRLESDSLADGW